MASEESHRTFESAKAEFTAMEQRVAAMTGKFDATLVLEKLAPKPTEESNA